MIVRHGILQEFLQSLTQHLRGGILMSHTNTLQQFFTKNTVGILLCLAIAIPAWFLGQSRPCSRRAGLLHLIGMIVTLIFKKEGSV